jgi:hypothetical protein
VHRYQASEIKFPLWSWVQLITNIALLMYCFSGMSLKSSLSALGLSEAILKFNCKPLNFIWLGEIREVVYLVYNNWHFANISCP